MNKTIKTISAQNTFTPAIRISRGLFSIFISGTFVATVTVQAAREDDYLTNGAASATWVDLTTTYTAPSIDVGEEGAIHYYRAGVKTGGFTSGSVTIEIAQLGDQA